MRRTLLQFLLYFAVLSVLLVRESRRLPLQEADTRFMNWLAGNATSAPPPAPVLLVEINDATLQGMTWPLTYLDYSLFFQSVSPESPPVVAVAAVLRPPEHDDALTRQYRQVLHDQIMRTPKVVLGATLGRREDTMRILPTDRLTGLQNVTGDLTRVPDYDMIEQTPEDEIGLSAAVGFLNMRERDLNVQRAPLIFRYRGQIVPSFILQTAMHWYKVTPEEVTVVVGKEIWLNVGVRIPIDDEGRMVVDFSTKVSRFGLDDLLLSSAQLDLKQAPTFPLERMKKEIVLLGRTDAASRTLRFPSGEEASLAELMARAIATVQQERFLERTPIGFSVALIAVLAVMGVYFTAWSRSRILVFSLLAIVIYLLVAITIFGAARMCAPLVLPLGLLVGIVVFGFITPGRRSARPVSEDQPTA